MSIAYLSLGSNMGDRLDHLQRAVDGLAAEAGRIVSVSGVYETDPVGGPAQGPYLNAVVAVETSLDARGLLAVAKRLEGSVGRDFDGARWGPRPLDIDILVVGDETTNDVDLTVPHPRMTERGFVLAPLFDVAPQLVGNEAARPASWPGVRRTALYLGVSE